MASRSVGGNSMPLFFSSMYICVTPLRSGWFLKASAQICIRLSTFSCITAGGSFLGPINFTRSLIKSFWATRTWNALPQFFTQVSSTVSVYMTTWLFLPAFCERRLRMARIASRAVSEDSLIMSQISILAAQFSDASDASVAASIRKGDGEWNLL